MEKLKINAILTIYTKIVEIFLKDAIITGIDTSRPVSAGLACISRKSPNIRFYVVNTKGVIVT